MAKSPGPRTPPLKRYVAFLRGVTPMNVTMPDLKAAFEAAGFADVKTVLSSGNVVFGAPASKEAELERRAEASMTKKIGRAFFTIVRPVDALQQIVASDPFAEFRLEPGSKRVVTFFRGKPKRAPSLPIEIDGARILCVRGAEAFTVYVRSPRGPVFMALIEKTFGKDITTRTFETVKKVAG